MWGRAVATVAMCAAMVAAMPMTKATRAGTGSSGAATPPAGSQLDGLGSDRPLRRLAPGSAQAPLTRRIDCARWQSLTLQLGETLAGRRMRQTVTGEACRQQGDAGAHVWDWPWAGGELTASLPPQLISEAGGWQVRCDASGRRRRCALVHQSVGDTDKSDVAAGQTGAVVGEGASDRSRHISTHFIIDTIAGRESVLWRVFVPAVRSETLAARALEAGTPQGTARGGATSAGEPRPHLRILGERPDKSADRPGYCSSAGCLIEAAPQRSAEIANRLAEGTAIEVRIDGASLPPSLVIAIPSHGFRAGFKELLRQRRDEERSPR